MMEAEAPVISTFILPPDDAALVEIQGTLQFVLEVANNFQLAIVSLQELYPLTDALELISQLRKALSNLCVTLQAAFENATGSAKLYSEIPNHLLNGQIQPGEHLENSYTRADLALSGFRGANAGLTTEAQGFQQTVRRMESIFDAMNLGSFDRDDGPRAFLFDAKNSKVYKDILQALLRAAQASQELEKYYGILKEHLGRMEDQLDTLHPLPDEVEAVCESWKKHHENSERLEQDFRSVSIYMRSPQGSALPWKPPFQSTSIPPPNPRTRATPFDPLSMPSAPIHNPPQLSSRYAKTS